MGDHEDLKRGPAGRVCRTLVDRAQPPASGGPTPAADSTGPPSHSLSLLDDEVGPGVDVEEPVVVTSKARLGRSQLPGGKANDGGRSVSSGFKRGGLGPPLLGRRPAQTPPRASPRPRRAGGRERGGEGRDRFWDA